MNDLERIEADALSDIAAAGDLAALEEARVRHTGRRSPLAAALASIGSLPPEERGAFGKRANAVREAVEAALAARREELDRKSVV